MKIDQTLFFSMLLVILCSFNVTAKPKKQIKNKLAENRTTELQIIPEVSLITTEILTSDFVNTDPVEDEEEAELITESTHATYYHDRFTGRKTASGEVFDNSKYTAAHNSLPFGTKVKVTNLKNKKSVILTITDRGSFSKERGIDITKKAFMEIAHNKGNGVLNVKIEKIEEPSS